MDLWSHFNFAAGSLLHLGFCKIHEGRSGDTSCCQQSHGRADYGCSFGQNSFPLLSLSGAALATLAGTLQSMMINQIQPAHGCFHWT